MRKIIMKKLFAITAVAAVVPSVVCARTLTVKAHNLGEKDQVMVKASNGGGLMRDFNALSFGSDSTVVINSGDSDLDVAYILTISGEKRVLKPVYLTDEATEVIIDPTARQFYTYSANVTPEMTNAAESVADCYDKYFWDYVTRKNDRLELRSDSAATSVYAKFMRYADSVGATYANLPAPVRNAMRQELALSIKRLWGEVSSRKSGEEWQKADSCLEKWVGLDAPYNALSRNFSSVAGIRFGRYLLNNGYTEEYLQAMPRPMLKTMRYDYYKKSYTGKNRETLLADLIHTDVADSEFTPGIDSLAADFAAEYPESPFRGLIDSDMASYRRANSGSENPDIVFIDSLETTTLEALTGRFKGRPVLVDVWATWCGPCRESFTKLKPVQDYAREHDIVLLYISIDTGENSEQQVRKLVGYYNLPGYHTIASESLRNDVFKTYGNERGAIMIPRTVLYDSEGNMVRDRINAEDHEAVLNALKQLGKSEN